MAYVSIDGNFRLQQKHKHNDPDDVTLNNGRAYFVPNEQYKKYIACVCPEPDVRVLSKVKLLSKIV